MEIDERSMFYKTNRWDGINHKNQQIQNKLIVGAQAEQQKQRENKQSQYLESRRHSKDALDFHMNVQKYYNDARNDARREMNQMTAAIQKQQMDDNR